MRAAHLCNGIGGSLWAGAILGWESIYALDHSQWRCDQIRKQATAGWWPGLRVDCIDLNGWEPTALDGALDILAAGFSCRDISTAGRGAGLAGPSTGPTYQGVLRAIDAWRPARVFLENSPEIRTRGRNTVIADLVARGYAYRDGIISAADVGAGHERDRWYCVAADLDHLRKLQSQGGQSDQWRWHRHCVKEITNADALGCEVGGGVLRQRQHAHSVGRSFSADAMRNGLQVALQRGWLSEADREAIEATAGYCGTYHWNPPNTDLLSMVHGVPGGVGRGDKGAWIAGFGDAWVPLQAAAAWRILGGQ